MHSVKNKDHRNLKPRNHAIKHRNLLSFSPHEHTQDKTISFHLNLLKSVKKIMHFAGKFTASNRNIRQKIEIHRSKKHMRNPNFSSHINQKNMRLQTNQSKHETYSLTRIFCSSINSVLNNLTSLVAQHEFTSFFLLPFFGTEPNSFFTLVYVER